MTSTKVSLLMSAGQALRPQWRVGFVPTEASTAELNPSQSGSLRGTGQGGRFCVGFGQLGQLSLTSGTPSPSLSAPGVGDAVEVGVPAGVADAVGVVPLAVVKFTTSTPLLVLPRGSSQSARKNRRC